MKPDPIDTLSNTVAQAQDLCISLADCDEEGLDPDTLRDFAAVMAGLLERAQDLCISLADCELVPVRSFAQLQRIRALRAEMETA